MIAKTYQDLLDEIQYYNTRISQLEMERKKIIIKAFGGPQGYMKNVSIEPTGIKGTNYFLSIDEACLRIDQINKIISECDEMLRLLQDQLAQINRLLYSLEGRQYKIFWLHRCERKSFQEIAKELGMSAKQVQRIYKEVVEDE